MKHFGLLFLLSASLMMCAGCGSDVDNGNVDNGNSSASDGNHDNASVCGDSTRQPGEQCDDGNTKDGDGCSANCKIEVKDCKVNSAMSKWFPEISTLSPEFSSESDSDAGWGDGEWGDGEWGDGEWGDGDGGDGDGGSDNDNTGGAGSSRCAYLLWKDDCVGTICNQTVIDEDGLKKVFVDLESSCGNGKKDNIFEECDDGNVIDGDGCNSFCKIDAPSAVCGNGKVESGEECDDGNKTNGDGCNSSCKKESSSATCGNFIVESGEECDEGNHGWDTETCTRKCKKVKIIDCPEPCTEKDTYCDSLSSGGFHISPQCVKGGVTGQEDKYSMGEFDEDDSGKCLESGYVNYITFGDSGKLSRFKIRSDFPIICTGVTDANLACLGGKVELVKCNKCEYNLHKTLDGESYVTPNCN